MLANDYTITLSLETRIVVHTIRYYANWLYPQLQQKFNIPPSTLHDIIHGASKSEKAAYLPCSRHRTINAGVKQQLVEAATASTHNRQLPLSNIANLIGVRISSQGLRAAFASEDYYRRVA